ncbi:arsenite methyltransferase [Cellulomonas olei]|uniref:arsenite methyltransferase n=1 Tax=Cellulomonas sp. P4 TaxID=3142533 RepID=UPI0031BB11BC
MVQDIREQVRARYALAAMQGSGDAGCCGGATGATTATGATAATAATDAVGCCGPQDVVVDDRFGSALYAAEDAAAVPPEALAASLGCGNPLVVAELREGERVLDLGSGGGIDVLLSARRVGPTGFAYGVDMTDEMLALARANAERAGATNVEFRRGTIEDLPLDDASVDVVISNCVVNLSPDKPAVLAEAFRVLAPGGRVGISDVVAEDHLTPEQRAERGSYVGCIAGALSRAEYLSGLAAAGFVDAEVTFTHPVADGMHGAVVRARKPEQPGEA